MNQVFSNYVLVLWVLIAYYECFKYRLITQPKQMEVDVLSVFFVLRQLLFVSVLSVVLYARVIECSVLIRSLWMHSAAIITVV